jgi:hypothetical protein
MRALEDTGESTPWPWRVERLRRAVRLRQALEGDRAGAIAVFPVRDAIWERLPRPEELYDNSRIT